MQHRLSSAFRIAPALSLIVLLGLANTSGQTQTIALEDSAGPLVLPNFAEHDHAQYHAQDQELPDSPSPFSSQQRSNLTPDGTVSSQAGEQPSHRERFHDYLRDSYGQRAVARSSGHPFNSGASNGWGQDTSGFSQGIGPGTAITAAGGNTGDGTESALGYIPCHGCSVKRKFANALLGDATPYNNIEGHHSFSPGTGFPGSNAAGTFGPSHNSVGGIVGTRSLAAARVGQHLITEFVWERRHRDPRHGD